MSRSQGFIVDVEAPCVVHEMGYQSSGSAAPRDLKLEISTVHYTTTSKTAPTFLATADLQGRENGDRNRLVGELVADEVMAMQELELLPRFDFCAICGDFYDYPDLRKLGGTGDVTPAINALAGTASQTFVVLGNHDEITRAELLPEIQVLDGDVASSGSLTLGGVSGIVGSPKRNNRKTEQKFVAAIEKCSTARTDILLLHQGPQGDVETQRGLDLVNAAVKNRSNLLVLFGHCHWRNPFFRSSRNLFCNVDARVLAFIPKHAS